jgi:anti-sigma factor RsiW
MGEDLHAFADQILDPARQAKVQAYLDAHPTSRPASQAISATARR